MIEIKIKSIEIQGKTLRTGVEITDLHLGNGELMASLNWYDVHGRLIETWNDAIQPIAEAVARARGMMKEFLESPSGRAMVKFMEEKELL